MKNTQQGKYMRLNIRPAKTKANKPARKIDPRKGHGICLSWFMGSPRAKSLIFAE